jgi:DNA-binding FadR family transcriptional regulator
MKNNADGERPKMPRSTSDIFSNLNSEKNGTSAEEVVGRLREMIQNGDLVPGDRLPPERDLAKLLGVSRPTLRAGIRSLTSIGILQSKQGAGTFVAEAEASPTLDTSALRLLSALHGFTSVSRTEPLSTRSGIGGAGRRTAGQRRRGGRTRHDG